MENPQELRKLLKQVEDTLTDTFASPPSEAVEQIVWERPLHPAGLVCIVNCHSDVNDKEWTDMFQHPLQTSTYLLSSLGNVCFIPNLAHLSRLTEIVEEGFASTKMELSKHVNDYIKALMSKYPYEPGTKEHDQVCKFVKDVGLRSTIYQYRNRVWQFSNPISQFIFIYFHYHGKMHSVNILPYLKFTRTSHGKEVCKKSLFDFLHLFCQMLGLPSEMLLLDGSCNEPSDETCSIIHKMTSEPNIALGGRKKKTIKNKFK